MKDEEILTQDEDELEEDISELEEEESEKSPAKKAEKQPIETKEVSETYEAFKQPARLGIVNTITEEVIEGFNPADEGIVQLGRAILNKLDKIGIASGV